MSVVESVVLNCWPIWLWLLDGQAIRRGWRIRRKRLLPSVLVSAVLIAIWRMNSWGLVSAWIAGAIEIALGVSYFLWAPWDDDDDNKRGRRRKLLNAWKQARQWLATGVPARQPQTSEGQA